MEDTVPQCHWDEDTGRLHRDDGPALIAEDGDKYWCQYGKFHREDGPAIIRHGGEEIWYLNDKQFSNPHEMPLSLFIVYCRWYKDH